MQRNDSGFYLSMVQAEKLQAEASQRDELPGGPFPPGDSHGAAYALGKLHGRTQLAREMLAPLPIAPDICHAKDRPGGCQCRSCEQAREAIDEVTR